MVLYLDECPAMICVKDASNKVLLTNNCYNHFHATRNALSSHLEDPLYFDPAGTYPTSSEVVFKDPVSQADLTFAIHKFVLTHAFEPPMVGESPSPLLCIMGMDISDRILFEKKVDIFYFHLSEKKKRKKESTEI
jgi:hypothetical protein